MNDATNGGGDETRQAQGSPPPVDDGPPKWKVAGGIGAAGSYAYRPSRVLVPATAWDERNQEVLDRQLNDRLGVVLVEDEASLDEKGNRRARTIAVNRDILIRSAALIVAFSWFMAQGARQGDTILAANAVLMHFVTFAAFFLDGLAFAAEALVGKAVGAAHRAGPYGRRAGSHAPHSAPSSCDGARPPASRTGEWSGRIARLIPGALPATTSAA